MRKFTNEESFLFNAFIRESKKQMYIMSFDENNKITGFKTFQKKKMKDISLFMEMRVIR